MKYKSILVRCILRITYHGYKWLGKNEIQYHGKNQFSTLHVQYYVPLSWFSFSVVSHKIET